MLLIRPTPDAAVPTDARQLRCYLALDYETLEDKENALSEAKRCVTEYKDDILAAPFTEQTLAQIQTFFGDFDPVFAALPHLLEVPNGLSVGNLRVDPAWDPLRKDPRFQKLIAEKP
jgi:hypothetical protein